MTVYAPPGAPDSLVSVQSRYGHWIGGEWVDPIRGNYFENISPVNGKPFTEIARGTEEDIEAALDAAHAAAESWGRTSTAERSSRSTRSSQILRAVQVTSAGPSSWVTPR